MRIEITEALWLDDSHELSLAQLAELSGLSEAELRHLVDYEALQPVDAAAADATFGAHCVVTARLACRLRNDFDLDTSGLALVMTLLERIRALEQKMQKLHAQLPRA